MPRGIWRRHSIIAILHSTHLPQSCCACRVNYACPLVHPLSTLALCPTLTRLSIITGSSAEAVSSLDMAALGRLTSLTRLSFMFGCPSEASSSMSFSQLSNLQQLEVSGIHPVDNQPQQQHVVWLPNSLTSLLVDYGDEYYSTSRNQLRAWLRGLPQPNQLQQLQALQCPAFAGPGIADLGLVQALRELHCSGIRHESFSAVVGKMMPDSVSKLSDLEVLWVESCNSRVPWAQHVWKGLNIDAVAVNCPKLKRLGAVMPFGMGNILSVPLAQLTELHMLDWVSQAPVEWFLPANFPQLQHLALEFAVLSQQLVDRLAGFTQLTQLRLDNGSACMRGSLYQLGAWASLDLLGSSLTKLVCLELVNCTAEAAADFIAGGAAAAAAAHPLALPPGLSSFTQIRQLHLFCVMGPGKPMPKQPSSVELLQGLSKLTQLEELQLKGYSTVTPGCLVGLVGALLQLQLLKVGLCKHPNLLPEAEEAAGAEARGAKGGLMGGAWDNVSPMVDEAVELCKAVNPQLRVEIGYALQWLD